MFLFQLLFTFPKNGIPITSEFNNNKMTNMTLHFHEQTNDQNLPVMVVALLTTIAIHIAFAKAWEIVQTAKFNDEYAYHNQVIDELDEKVEELTKKVKYYQDLASQMLDLNIGINNT